MPVNTAHVNKIPLRTIYVFKLSLWDHGRFMWGCEKVQREPGCSSPSFSQWLTSCVRSAVIRSSFLIRIASVLRVRALKLTPLYPMQRFVWPKPQSRCRAIPSQTCPLRPTWTHSPLLPLPLPDPCLPLCNLVISRMFCKWNIYCVTFWDWRFRSA